MQKIEIRKTPSSDGQDTACITGVVLPACFYGRFEKNRISGREDKMVRIHRISVSDMFMYIKAVFLGFILLSTAFGADLTGPAPAIAQQTEASGPVETTGKLVLGRTTMCEAIVNSECRNPAIVFSITNGRVSCYTSFEQIPSKTFVYHNWFHKDRIVSKIKLSLQPPRWSTFSSIQFRETDKGPWRVEITDGQDKLINVLRFSVVD